MFALLPVLWMRVEFDKPSDLVQWIMYATVYIPAFVVMYRVLPLDQGLSIFSVALLGCQWGLGRILNVPHFRLKSPLFSQTMFSALVYGATIVLYAHVVIAFGFQIRWVSLADVYNVRYEYRDSIIAAGSTVAYAVSWLANVMNPLLFALGLTRRKFWLVVLSLSGQLMLYSITGLKSLLFSGLFLTVIVFVLRSRGSKFGTSIVAGLSFVILLSVLLDKLANTAVFSSLFIRRELDMSGLLTTYYFEFFRDNPKAMLGHSILKGIVRSSYQTTPPFIIGEAFFGNPQMSANANFWADAFANFGYIGFSNKTSGDFRAYLRFEFSFGIDGAFCKERSIGRLLEVVLFDPQSELPTNAARESRGYFSFRRNLPFL